MNSFQWRLSHQWQGRRDQIAAALFARRIGVDEEGSSFFGWSWDLALFPGHFELDWTRLWGQSFQTSVRLMPAITAEDSAGKNRYTAWGELLVQSKGLGLGVGRLEVSGPLCWWPLLYVRQQWLGIRVEGLFPRYLDIQKGQLALRARLEGATYQINEEVLVESVWIDYQTLYFSQLDVGVALVVKQGPLTMDLEIGRAMKRRFELKQYPGIDEWFKPFQGIDGGWYIRSKLKGG